MKPIILSADNAPSVYLVPNVVAERLNDFVLEFDVWLREAPEANEHILVSYTEEDFIKWLNKFKFPDELSILVEQLGWNKIPSKYKECPRFNF
jgi:hypothetical protein